MKRYLMVMAASTLAMIGSAWGYCSEPDTPFCVGGYGPFNEYEFDSCKRDMESYRSEIEDFAQCRQREVDEANEAARRAVNEAEEVARKARDDVQQQASDYEDAVRSFNQRAGG